MRPEDLASLKTALDRTIASLTEAIKAQISNDGVTAAYSLHNGAYRKQLETLNNVLAQIHEQMLVKINQGKNAQDEIKIINQYNCGVINFMPGDDHNLLHYALRNYFAQRATSIDEQNAARIANIMAILSSKKIGESLVQNITTRDLDTTGDLSISPLHYFIVELKRPTGYEDVLHYTPKEKALFEKLFELTPAAIRSKILPCASPPYIQRQLQALRNDWAMPHDDRHLLRTLDSIARPARAAAANAQSTSATGDPAAPAATASPLVGGAAAAGFGAAGPASRPSQHTADPTNPQAPFFDFARLRHGLAALFSRAPE